MRNDNSFLALLSGVALGAIAGLLLAPDKGTETFRKVKESARDFSDKLQDQFEEGKEEVKDHAERVKSQANEFGSKAEKEINIMQNKAEKEYNKKL